MEMLVDMAQKLLNRDVKPWDKKRQIAGND